MNTSKIFWGLTLVLGAVVLIINKLGYFPEINVFSLIFSIFLISFMFKSLFKLNFWGILFPIAFICILYDDQLGITSLTPWTVLGAALLGSIGLSMIFPKRSKHRHFNVNFSNTNADYQEGEIIDIIDENNIFLETAFASSVKYINADALETATLKCHFGGMKVYFDNAVLHEGKGLINIDASFSGIELYIPKNFSIEDKLNVAFGSVTEKNRNTRHTENVLTLVGNINFSDISIFYV